MNKQELIERIKRLDEPYLKSEFVLELVKQLDEPEKIKIPQFVADVIEGAREQSPELEDALHYAWGNGTKEFTEWYNKKSNRDLFARAWLNGYEVEEEKRYRVKMKGIVNALSFLSYHKNADIWKVTDKNNSDGHRAHHTRKELEDANFGWVFDCPGIEIEEVE